jgi:hypothetical protein
MRLGNSLDGDSAAPYAMPSARSTSQSSGKGNPCCSAKAAFCFASSKEAPRISAFFAWNSA